MNLLQSGSKFVASSSRGFVLKRRKGLNYLWPLTYMIISHCMWIHDLDWLRTFVLVALLGFNWASVFEHQPQRPHIAHIALHYIVLSRLVGRENPLDSFASQMDWTLFTSWPILRPFCQPQIAAYRIRARAGQKELWWSKSFRIAWSMGPQRLDWRDCPSFAFVLCYCSILSIALSIFVRIALVCLLLLWLSS